MSTLLLNGKDVRELLNMSDTIIAVGRAFKEWTRGKGKMPPKAYLVLEQGDFRAMPAALPGAVAVKWVNVHCMWSAKMGQCSIFNNTNSNHCL